MTVIFYARTPQFLLMVDFQIFFIRGPLWPRETRRSFHLYEAIEACSSPNIPVLVVRQSTYTKTTYQFS